MLHGDVEIGDYLPSRGDALEQELRRAKAVTDVAAQCIANANTVIRAAQVVDGAASSKFRLPRMVAGE